MVVLREGAAVRIGVVWIALYFVNCFDPASSRLIGRIGMAFDVKGSPGIGAGVWLEKREDQCVSCSKTNFRHGLDNSVNGFVGHFIVERESKNCVADPC